MLHPVGGEWQLGPRLVPPRLPRLRLLQGQQQVVGEGHWPEPSLQHPSAQGSTKGRAVVA